MKYLKGFNESIIFEELRISPKVGDYVKVNISKYREYDNDKKVIKFYSNNFGRIVEVIPISSQFKPDRLDRKILFPYRVKFSKSLPSYPIHNHNYINLSLDEIEEFASTEEELKIKLDSKKYNL